MEVKAVATKKSSTKKKGADANIAKPAPGQGTVSSAGKPESSGKALNLLLSAPAYAEMQELAEKLGIPVERMIEEAFRYLKTIHEQEMAGSTTVFRNETAGCERYPPKLKSLVG